MKNYSVEKRNFNNSKKKVLVTGATGHLGFNLCLYLIKNNFNVFAFCRKNSNVNKLKNKNVKIIYGDVKNYTEFYSAAIGKNFIIHAAAIYSHDEDLRNETLKTAKKSAENFCKIINKLDIEKGIYISSVSILGLNKKPIKKKKLSIIENSEDPYVKSKLESYKIIKKEISKYNLPVTIILPSSMIGLNDYRITPSSSNIRNMMKTIIGFYVDGGINIINIKDVCISIIQILLLKKNTTYVLSGYDIEVKNLVKEVRFLAGRSIFSLKLTKNFFLIIYYIHKFLGLKIMFKFPLNIFQIKNIGKFSYFDNSKAKKDGLLKLTSLKTTLRECLENF